MLNRAEAVILARIAAGQCNSPIMSVDFRMMRLCDCNFYSVTYVGSVCRRELTKKGWEALREYNERAGKDAGASGGEGRVMGG